MQNDVVDKVFALGESKMYIENQLFDRINQAYQCEKSVSQVLNDEEGRPFVNLLKKDIPINEIDISISHCKTYAVASVVAIYG